MTEIDDAARAAIAALDPSEVPDTFLGRKLLLMRERPDLMWLEDDDDAERDRKQAEFDALLISREPKH